MIIYVFSFVGSVKSIQHYRVFTKLNLCCYEYLLHSGSGLLSRVLSALLELTYIVTEDNVPENVQLLTYLHTQTISSGDEGATTANASSALFANMLQKANTITADTPSLTVTPSTSSSAHATDACLAKEFGSVSEYVQWRVQVLQRIQLPLAAAFR